MDETSRLARQCAFAFMVLRVVPVTLAASTLGLIWIN